MTRKELAKAIREDYIRQGVWAVKTTNITMNLDFEMLEIIREALEREACDDCISRSSIKHKLQEHHDFFVNAYDGFSNLPPNDKSRVDEITNCIAMVVNEPPVTTSQPNIAHWIKSTHGFKCSRCLIVHSHSSIFCPSCGAKMIESPPESEGKE